MRYGVIDVGSNSVRLMVNEDGKTVYKKAKITRLAQGLAGNLMLNEESIERTVTAVDEFKFQAQEDCVDKIFVFATAGVRQAKNGLSFVNRVKDVCSLKVDVISGEQEAVIGAMGVLGDKDGAIIDVGGASSEITVISGGKVVYAKSLDIGAVKLTDEFHDDKDKLFNFLQTKLKEYGNVPISEFYGIGGTATSIAAILQELEPYDSEKVHGYKITVSTLEKLCDRLMNMSEEERAKLKGLQKGREKIIATGSALLLAIAKYLNIDKITVSESDNLEGYLTVKRREYE